MNERQQERKFVGAVATALPELSGPQEQSLIESPARLRSLLRALQFDSLDLPPVMWQGEVNVLGSPTRFSAYENFGSTIHRDLDSAHVAIGSNIFQGGTDLEKVFKSTHEEPAGSAILRYGQVTEQSLRRELVFAEHEHTKTSPQSTWQWAYSLALSQVDGRRGPLLVDGQENVFYLEGGVELGLFYYPSPGKQTQGRRGCWSVCLGFHGSRQLGNRVFMRIN